jgi:cystathionine beta-lyase
MKYDFDRIIDRRNSDSVKWHAFESDVLPMWVADMDFASPEPVIQALHERVEHGIYGYPEGAGLGTKTGRELIEILINRLLTRYHWQVHPEELVFLPGVVSAFNLACHTVAVPGGEVIIQTPVYYPFLTAPRNANQKRIDNHLIRIEDGSYQIDFDSFREAITPQTHLFILCNPHNPVGRVFQTDELQRLAEICIQREMIICSDEIHCDLIYQGHHHIPIASLDPEVAKHTITLMAPSKTFNIAGLQCSFAVIPDPELRKRFLHNTKGLSGWVNIMGLTAALAAYRSGNEWLEQLIIYLQANRDLLYEFIQEQIPEIMVSPIEGTYLAWLDCRNISGEKPSDFFLRKARVAMNDGELFGNGGAGFVRINFGCPRSTLIEALDRMKKAVKRLQLS